MGSVYRALMELADDRKVLSDKDVTAVVKAVRATANEPEVVVTGHGSDYGRGI